MAVVAVQGGATVESVANTFPTSLVDGGEVWQWPAIRHWGTSETRFPPPW